MDKYEYRVKTEKMISYMEEKSYGKAMEIADTIDWRRVRNVSMLYSVSKIYEECEQFQKSRNILFLAYDRAPDNKKIIYQLGQLAIKMGDVNEAMDCYDELLVIAPKDPNQYILRFGILKAEGASLPQQIEALAKYKKIEYVEKWAYELADLYYQAGMYEECGTECNDLILWFGEGEYIAAAQGLKIKSEKALEGFDYTSYKEVPKFNPVEIKETVLDEEAVISGETVKISDADLQAIRTIADEMEPELTGKTVMIDTASVAQALESNQEATNSREITGQLRIDEILAGWEEKQKEMEAAIAAEKARAQEAEASSEESSNDDSEDVEEEAVAEETVETPVPVPILDDEIRQLMEDIENGVEPESTYVENKGAFIEDIALDVEEEALESLDDLEDMDQDDYADEFEDIEDLQDMYEDEDDDALEVTFDDAELEDVFEDEIEYEDEIEDEIEYEDEFDDEDDDEYEAEELVKSDEEIQEESVEYDENLDEELFDSDENAIYETDEEFEAEALEGVEVKIPEYQEAIEDNVVSEEVYEEDEDFSVDFEMDKPMNMEEEEINLSLEERVAPTRIEVAKAVATGKTAKLPVSEIAKAIAAGGTIGADTGFIVQAKYDLEAQSEIGLRAGLSEEQKKLFSYFVPVRGMSEQLVDVLERDKYCSGRAGTSKTGNLLVIGRKGSGKTVLAVDVVKAIQKNRDIAQGKVAIVTGDAMNKKKVSDVMSKLYGGALIIEKANQMNDKTVTRLNKAMERDTGELLIVLEDERKPLDTLLSSNVDFRRKFTSRLEVPIFINDELVTFGQTYARENECKIDEMGILALYSRIDMIQRDDHPVTVAEVKDILDDAIDKAKKHGVKRLAKKMFHKPEDEGRRFILTEKHFKN